MRLVSEATASSSRISSSRAHRHHDLPRLGNGGPGSAGGLSARAGTRSVPGHGGRGCPASRGAWLIARRGLARRHGHRGCGPRCRRTGCRRARRVGRHAGDRHLRNVLRRDRRRRSACGLDHERVAASLGQPPGHHLPVLLGHRDLRPRLQVLEDVVRPPATGNQAGNQRHQHQEGHEVREDQFSHRDRHRQTGLQITIRSDTMSRDALSLGKRRKQGHAPRRLAAALPPEGGPFRPAGMCKNYLVHY